MGSHLWFPSSPPNLNIDCPRSSATYDSYMEAVTMGSEMKNLTINYGQS